MACFFDVITVDADAGGKKAIEHFFRKRVVPFVIESVIQFIQIHERCDDGAGTVSAVVSVAEEVVCVAVADGN